MIVICFAGKLAAAWANAAGDERDVATSIAATRERFNMVSSKGDERLPAGLRASMVE
jgi:hypothetical protein